MTTLLSDVGRPLASNGSHASLSQAEAYDQDRILRDREERLQRLLDPDERCLMRERYCFLIAAIVFVVAGVATAAGFVVLSLLVDSPKTFLFGAPTLGCMLGAQYSFKQFRLNCVAMQTLRGHRLEIALSFSRALATVHLLSRPEILDSLAQLTKQNTNPVLADSQTTAELEMLKLAHKNGPPWKAVADLVSGCRKEGHPRN